MPLRLLRNAIFILASSASTAHSVYKRGRRQTVYLPPVPDKCKNNGGFTRIPRKPVCQTDAPSFCYVSNMTPKLTRGPMGLSPRSPDPCHAMPWHPHDFFIALNVHAQRRRMTFFTPRFKEGNARHVPSSFFCWKMPRVILLASHVLTRCRYKNSR